MSKRLQRQVTPDITWKSLTVSANEWDLSNLQAVSVVKHNAHNLRYVKALEITAPFVERLGRRCEEDETAAEKEQILEAQLASIRDDDLDAMDFVDDFE